MRRHSTRHPLSDGQPHGAIGLFDAIRDDHGGTPAGRCGFRRPLVLQACRAHGISFDLFATPVSVEFRSDVNPFLKDKPKEKRGLKTSQKERRERRIKKDRAKRPAKKK